MIAAWMLWSVCAGAVVFVGGLAVERVLTLYRRPTRWTWVAAAAVTLLLPLARFLGPAPEAAPLGGPVPVVEIEPLAMTVQPDSPLRSLDDLLLMGWVGLSTLMLVMVLFAGARLARRRRDWPRGRLLDQDVAWSDALGPAVVGILRPEIVVPGWVRAVPDDHQSLILTHEVEHLRKRDPQLRVLMGALVLLFPWNLALWLQLHRLNLAIELDCDRRVMRRMPGSRRAYGDLLLQVGARRSGLQGLAVAALSEEPSLLERRIRDLVWRAPEARLAQAGVLVFGAMLAVSVVLALPGIRSGLESGDEAAPVSPVEADDATSSAPTFTPFTVAPDILNRPEIQEALEAEYPPLLREAGIGGTVKVWFSIDEEGVVRQVRVNTSSGHEALDQAALRVADIFRFTPARNRDEVVPVWVALDITFEPEATAREPEERTRPPAPREPVSPTAMRVTKPLAELRQGPDFTPFTTAPDITNRPEVQNALEAEYPPLLREAGIGGTVKVWFLIDAEGNTDRVVLMNGETSGHEALDQAALRVARTFRFTPARNQGEIVPVWVVLNITFSP